jgi:hypothetical protein
MTDAAAIYIMVVVVFVAVLAVLVCREVICWYWKVNRIVKLLEGIDEVLRRR